jgi:hypothetical protein
MVLGYIAKFSAPNVSVDVMGCRIFLLRFCTMELPTGGLNMDPMISSLSSLDTRTDHGSSWIIDRISGIFEYLLFIYGWKF